MLPETSRSVRVVLKLMNGGAVHAVAGGFGSFEASAVPDSTGVGVEPSGTGVVVASEPASAAVPAGGGVVSLLDEHATSDPATATT
jgi:hypothetical protein